MIEHWIETYWHKHVMSMSCPKILTSKMQLSFHYGYAALQRKSACLAFPKAIFHALITMI